MVHRRMRKHEIHIGFTKPIVFQVPHFVDQVIQLCRCGRRARLVYRRFGKVIANDFSRNAKSGQSAFQTVLTRAMR